MTRRAGRSWALRPRGWLRADGHRGITRHNPAYTVDNMSGIATVTAT